MSVAKVAVSVRESDDNTGAGSVNGLRLQTATSGLAVLSISVSNVIEISSGGPASDGAVGGRGLLDALGVRRAREPQTGQHQQPDRSDQARPSPASITRSAAGHGDKVVVRRHSDR